MCIACVVFLSGCGEATETASGINTSQDVGETAIESATAQTSNNNDTQQSNSRAESSKSASTLVKDASSPEEDPYVGEYGEINSYDVNEPSLEIQKNKDGTYVIQLGVYRLTTMDDSVGVATDRGLEFSSTDGFIEGGYITLEGNIATAHLFGSYFEGDIKSEYEYLRLSSVSHLNPYIAGIGGDEIYLDDDSEAPTHSLEKSIIEQKSPDDLYTGEYVGEIDEADYLKYHIRKPILEIQRNEDATYIVQVEMYGLTFLYDGVGTVTEDGLAFTTVSPHGNLLEGIVTLEGDTATVRFLSEAWERYSPVSEYQYYRHSNTPQIYVAPQQIP